jgi:adenylyltransferase/sulfurtransferase
MSTDELAARLASREVVVLDVREDWELEAEPFEQRGSVAAAEGVEVHHVPSGVFFAGGAAAESALAGLPRDTVVAVLCKAGPRSERVAEAARAAGVDARTVEGGVLAWSSAASV